VKEDQVKGRVFRPLSGLGHVLKANPYHDQKGRFSTHDSASSVSTGPQFQSTIARLKAQLIAEKAKAAKVKYYDSQDDTDLTKYDTEALKETLDQWKSLSPKQRKAVKDYTDEGDGHDYYHMNRAVGQESQGMSDKMTPDMKAAVATLDGALAKGTLHTNTKLYKAINLGRSGHKGFNEGTTAEEAKGLIGEVIHDPAFSSTSASVFIAHNFQTAGRVILEIAAPKGTPGMYVGNDKQRSANPREHEFILPRGAKYRITGAREVDLEFAGLKMHKTLITAEVFYP